MTPSSGPLRGPIAAALRAELERQERSGRWLARKAGYSHARVARWLNEETDPCADDLQRMCKALGFTVADLMVAVVGREEGNPRRRVGDRLGLRLAA